MEKAVARFYPDPTVARNQTKTQKTASNPRATMRALLQTKLCVRLGGPSRQIAKRTNRINGLIWIRPVDELIKGNISFAFIAPHVGVPGNRGC
jgi:hypothetical protein